MEPETSVLGKRILDQQVRHLSAFLTTADRLAGNPNVGTPARADLDHGTSHPQQERIALLRGLTYRSCRLDVRSAHEHLRGVAVLIAVDELLPLPMLAVARSVYEAVLNTCWLLDSEVTTELRLARWAGRVLHDSQEGPNTLDEFGPSTSAQAERMRVAQGREQSKQFLRDAGFILKPKGGARSDETAKVTYLGASSGVSPNLTESVARFTPNQTSLLPVFSGAAHSRGWLVSGLEGSRADLMGMVLLPLLDTSDALAIEVGRYFGLDPQQILGRTHLQRQVLTRHIRPNSSPSAGVNEYRAAGGAPPVP